MAAVGGEGGCGEIQYHENYLHFHLGLNPQFYSEHDVTLSGLILLIVPFLSDLTFSLLSSEQAAPCQLAVHVKIEQCRGQHHGQFSSLPRQHFDTLTLEFGTNIASQCLFLINESAA